MLQVRDPADVRSVVGEAPAMTAAEVTAAYARAITTAAGFDDAVRLANDTVYGLAAAVFTTSLTSASRFIDLAEAGQVAVNLPTAGWDVHHPFGGFRDSGSPFKEQGSPGLRFYTRIKTAAVRFAW